MRPCPGSSRVASRYARPVSARKRAGERSISMASRPLVVLLSATVLLTVPALSGARPVPDPTIQARHDTEAVVLKGSDLDAWSAPANQTVKLPLLDFPESFQCFADESTCDTHNNYAEPEVDTAKAAAPEGTPTNRL